MRTEPPGNLRSAEGLDPIWRAWDELPLPWRGPVIGPGIEDWESITENGDRRIDLTGLPEPFGAELAWMARWQAADGTRSSVLATNQLANILRRALREDHPIPASIREMDWAAASALQGWFYAHRWGRLPPAGSRSRLRVVFRFARLALLARCNDGPWWALGNWHPRCDPRIPLTGREPQGNYGCSPGQITQVWLREAVKWHLGTMLEAGTLRWSWVATSGTGSGTWLAGARTPSGRSRSAAGWRDRDVDGSGRRRRAHRAWTASLPPHLPDRRLRLR